MRTLLIVLNGKLVTIKMVVDMELEQAKEAVFQLMKEKEKLENDIKEARAILECVRI